MKAGWFWPMLGKHCDFVFNSAASRGRRVVEQLLMGFSGTLQTDGYEVYARHRTDHENINHAVLELYKTFFSWVASDTNDLERSLRVIPKGQTGSFV